jgi:hypothetical protein
MSMEFILQFRYKKSRHVAKGTQRNVKNSGKKIPTQYVLREFKHK